MPFPTIPAVADGRIAGLNQLNTTATLTGPDLSTLTKGAGDLLIAIAGEYQSNAGTDAAYTGWAGGGLTWTEIRDSTGTAVNRLGVAYARVVTGSETGTVTVTRSGTLTGDASMIVLVIPGAHATSAPEANTMSTGTGTATPGTLAPSWGADDTLWIAVNGNGMTSGTGSWTANNGAPTNYTGYYGTAPADTSTVGDFGAAVAFRQLNASSETAGAFSQDTSNARNSALLIAVRPTSTLAASSNEPVGITDALTVELTRNITVNDAVGISDGIAAVPAAWVATASVNNALTNSFVVNRPGAVVANDVMVLHIARWDASSLAAPTSLPDGSTSIGSQQISAPTEGGFIRSDVIVKRVGAESSWTTAFAASNWSNGTALFFRNVPTGFDLTALVAQFATAPAATTSMPTVSITALADGALAFFAQGLDQSVAWTGTPPTGFTERRDGDFDYAASLENTSAGSVSASGGTASASQAWIAALVAVAGTAGTAGVLLEVTKGIDDPVGITDALAVDLTTSGLSFSASDPIGITDAAALEQQRTRNDPVGASDTVALEQQRTLADAVGVTDAAALEQRRTVADAVGVTDATQLDRALVATDPVGVTDAATVVAALDRTSNSPVGVADALVIERSVTAADAVGVTDAVTAVILVDLSAADAIGITDTAVLERALAIADALGVTDIASTTVSAERTAADPVGVTDATLLERGTTPADAAAVTDTVVTELTMPRAAADPVGVSDALVVEQTFNRSAADAVGVTDALQATREIVVNDPVGATDTAARIITFSRTVNDDVDIQDSVTAGGTGVFTADDPVTITDDAVTTLHIVRTTVDAVGATDALTLTRGVLPADAVDVTDAALVEQTLPRALDDVAGVTDALSVARGASVGDVVAVSDALTVELTYVVDVADVVGVTDATSLAVELTFSDAVGVRDAAALAGLAQVDYEHAHVIVLAEPTQHVVVAANEVRHVLEVPQSIRHIVIFEE